MLPKMSVTVAQVIVTHGDKVLLMRRSAKRNIGMWEFPCGKVDDDEIDILDAAARELREESGLSIDKRELVLYDTAPKESDMFPGTYYVCVSTMIDKSKCHGVEKIMEPHMFDKMAWVSIEEVKDYPLAPMAAYGWAVLCHKVK